MQEEEILDGTTPSEFGTFTPQEEYKPTETKVRLPFGAKRLSPSEIASLRRVSREAYKELRRLSAERAMSQFTESPQDGKDTEEK